MKQEKAQYQIKLVLDLSDLLKFLLAKQDSNLLNDLNLLRR